MSNKFFLLAGYSGSLINFRGPLIQELINSNIEVHVAAPELINDSATYLKLAEMGVQVHNVFIDRTGVNPFKDLKALINIWLVVQSIKPDYFLAYTIKPVIFGGLAAWLAGVPNRFALITGLGYAFQGVNGKRELVKKIVQNLYSFSLSKMRKVFFQNPDDMNLFYSLGILEKDKSDSIVVNGSGIDLKKFQVESLPNVTSFLLIARLLGDKGIREFVDAAKIVKQSYPEIEFYLVGWIDDNPDSIKQSELDFWINSGLIEYKGRLSDVRLAIRHSSVYVLPSYREGTPRTVLEAMAMGRPIITTDAPGCRETVVDGDNGFLVSIKSVDQLVSAMLSFIEQPDLISRMGKRSRHIAEEKYDVKKVNDHMLREMGIK